MGLGCEFGRPGYSSCYSLRGPFSIHSNPEQWHYAKSSPEAGGRVRITSRSCVEDGPWVQKS